MPAPPAPTSFLSHPNSSTPPTSPISHNQLSPGNVHHGSDCGKAHLHNMSNSNASINASNPSDSERSTPSWGGRFRAIVSHLNRLTGASAATNSAYTLTKSAETNRYTCSELTTKEQVTAALAEAARLATVPTPALVGPDYWEREDMAMALMRAVEDAAGRNPDLVRTDASEEHLKTLMEEQRKRDMAQGINEMFLAYADQVVVLPSSRPW